MLTVSACGGSRSSAGRPQVVIHIKASIDGHSRLILQGRTARWDHLDYDAPGRYGNTPLPTVINGVKWFPKWPDKPNRENRGCECFSDTFTGVRPPVPPPLMGHNLAVSLEPVKCRSSCTVEAVGGKVTIDFNDDGPAGADSFDVKILVSRGQA